MPALRMKRKFNDDDLGNEFDACSNSTKSIRTLHSQVSEFEQSVVLTSSYENPQDETDLTTQLAGQDIRIMKDADFGDVFKGTSYSLVKVLQYPLINNSRIIQVQIAGTSKNHALQEKNPGAQAKAMHSI